MRPEEMIERCRTDLDGIDENLRWVVFDGYRPTNAAPAPVHTLSAAEIAGTTEQRSTPADAASDPPANPDAVNAPRFDVGVGDHRSRTAYHRSIGHLRRAEAALALAVHIAATSAPRPAMVKPGPGATLHRLTECCRGMRASLRLLERSTVDGDAVKALRAAMKALDRAWRILNHAFERGEINPDTHAFATRDLCRICKIRPRADRKGGRCHTCAQWFQRNGFERPTKLDSIADALAAQRRRRARGEGWGDESLSAATANGKRP